jgi:osmotically-inducible protein OsmY
MKKLNRTFAVLLSAAVLGLAGCSTSGGQAVSTFFDDASTTAKVKKAIFDEPSLKVIDVSVTTENGVVELSGSVKTARERTKAAEIARRVEGVKRVRNDLKVQ